MKKNALLHAYSIVALCMLNSAVLADIKTGQKTYLKECKKCHGNGAKGAAMKTQSEWEELFEENAGLLKKKHAGDTSETYFNSRKFTKYASHLKEFLLHYGADSGNVPVCK